jgi:hypothetical protein
VIFSSFGMLRSSLPTLEVLSLSKKKSKIADARKNLRIIKNGGFPKLEAVIEIKFSQFCFRKLSRMQNVPSAGPIRSLSERKYSFYSFVKTDYNFISHSSYVLLFYSILRKRLSDFIRREVILQILKHIEFGTVTFKIFIGLQKVTSIQSLTTCYL